MQSAVLVKTAMIYLQQEIRKVKVKLLPIYSFMYRAVSGGKFPKIRPVRTDWSGSHLIWVTCILVGWIIGLRLSSHFLLSHSLHIFPIYSFIFAIRIRLWFVMSSGVVRWTLFRPSLKIQNQIKIIFVTENSKIEFDLPFQTCSHHDSFDVDLDLVPPVQTDQNMNSFPAVMSAHDQTLQQRSQPVLNCNTVLERLQKGFKIRYNLYTFSSIFLDVKVFKA